MATDKTVQPALWLGVAVPLIYFGVQLLAAPFYPDYSFLDCDASTLGSSGSNCPMIFNSGAILCGVATLTAAWGFHSMLGSIGAGALARWLTVSALICLGLGSINAGIFPLPDTRHIQGPLATLGAFGFTLPFILPKVFWRSGTKSLRVYLVANLVALLALVPIVSGWAQRAMGMAGVEYPAFQTFLNNYHGILQRIAAAVIFIPIGVCSYYLLTSRCKSVTKTATSQ